MAVRRTGRVKRIYATSGRAFIRLDIPSSQAPKFGYFELEKTHSNYNALYSLALTAAVNNYRLQIRTVDHINQNEVAKVAYVVVDW